jgi:small conductance mechanosensitive channel
MLKVTNSLINYVVKIIAFLVILSIWGVDVLPALAGLGILGLVVGLGAQSLIKDLIAGFFIIFEHHFDIDDVVEINGFKGRVIDIGLKTTRVQNWKNDIKIFSNGSISEPINYSVANSMAIVEFGIAYHEDIQKTIDLLNQELPKYKALLPELLEIPTVLGVTDLASSSVNIRVICKTLPESQYNAERKLRQGIKEILDANGIEIPFPQVVVHEPKK